MLALGHHLVLRLADDRVIAPSDAERRALARVLAELASVLPVLAWKVADTHMHVVILGSEEDASEFIRRLRLRFAVGLKIEVALEVQRRKPIVDQSHLLAAFRYTLAQDTRHGVLTDPHQECSSLTDILGLRVVCPEIVSRVREHLPRVTRGDLLPFLGRAELEPAFDPGCLAEAACAAFAIPELGLRGEGAQARHAAVCAGAGLRPSELAKLLGVTVQCAARLAARPAPTRHVRAVGLQMALRRAIPLERAVFDGPGLPA